MAFSQKSETYRQTGTVDRSNIRVKLRFICSVLFRVYKYSNKEVIFFFVRHSVNCVADTLTISEDITLEEFVNGCSDGIFHTRTQTQTLKHIRARVIHIFGQQNQNRFSAVNAFKRLYNWTVVPAGEYSRDTCAVTLGIVAWLSMFPVITRLQLCQNFKLCSKFRIIPNFQKIKKFESF